jgi:Ca2+-binding RTX toxin-like protein
VANIDLTGFRQYYIFKGPDTVSVDFGATVWNAGGFAIDDDYINNVKLFNYGTIHSGTDTGVLFFGNNNTVYNEPLATISGYDGVMLWNGNADTVNNSGSISTTDYGVWMWGNTLGVINNFGVIHGDNAGIYAFWGSGSSTIYNTWSISGGDGIRVVIDPASTIAITNAPAGAISGEGTGHGIAIVYGAISLNNEGSITHGIYDVYNGDNVIVNSGSITGGITFGNGNEIYNASGGGTVDYIDCGSDTNQIILGSGNTTVLLGSGRDTVTAGSGQDTFWFSSHTQIDRINQFHKSLDYFVLSKSGFSGITSDLGSLSPADFHIGPKATNHSQHIIYNAQNGFLYYDADGSGPHHQVHFATLAPHLDLTASDFLVSV